MLIKLFAEPLPLFFLVSFLGAVVAFWRRRLGASIVGLGIVALYAVSTPYLGARLLAGLEVHAPLAIDDAAPAEAIVVLAAGIRREAPEFGAEIGDALVLERLRYAAFLQRRTGLPVLVSGGAVRPGDSVLADVMAADLERDFGLGVRWRERRSRTTFENARETAAILQGAGIGPVLLVTHAWHMPRAAEAFERQGVAVIPAPTGYTSLDETAEAGDFVPQARALLLSSYAAHEWIGRLWYALARY